MWITLKWSSCQSPMYQFTGEIRTVVKTFRTFRGRWGPNIISLGLNCDCEYMPKDHNSGQKLAQNTCHFPFTELHSWRVLLAKEELALKCNNRQRCHILKCHMSDLKALQLRRGNKLSWWTSRTFSTPQAKPVRNLLDLATNHVSSVFWSIQF